MQAGSVPKLIVVPAFLDMPSELRVQPCAAAVFVLKALDVALDAGAR